jgi:hypothetical protein
MADDKAPKNKAALLMALGPLKAKPGVMGGDESEPDDDEAMPEPGEVKSMAASDAMDALKSGDAKAFEDALTRFVGAC